MLYPCIHVLIGSVFVAKMTLCPKSATLLLKHVRYEGGIFDLLVEERVGGDPPWLDIVVGSERFTKDMDKAFIFVSMDGKFWKGQLSLRDPVGIPCGPCSFWRAFCTHRVSTVGRI
jgi:hypothetical protein